jgi:hypothetical protein
MPDTQATTYRLTDILTKEVSIVDRAANQRTFLLVKRAGGAAQELVPDGKGGMKAQKSETSQATPPGNADPKGSEPGKQEPPPAKEPPAKPATMTKTTHAGIVKTIEQLTALAQSVKLEELSETDGPAVETALASAVSNLGTVVTKAEELTTPGWVDGVCKLATVDLQKALKTASQKLGEVAESLAVKTEAGEPPEEVRWKIMDVLHALVQLSQFETAQEALEKRESEKSAFSRIVKGLQRAIGESEKAPAPLPVVKSAAFDPDDAIKLVSAAERVVKAYRAQGVKLQKRVLELEAQPRQSNRIAIDLHKQADGARTTWPSDMNAKHLTDEDYDFDRASANG